MQQEMVSTTMITTLFRNLTVFITVFFVFGCGGAPRYSKNSSIQNTIDPLETPTPTPTPTATATPTSTPVTLPPVTYGYKNPNNRFDVNNNGVVNATDLTALKGELKKVTDLVKFPNLSPRLSPPDLYIDINGDWKLSQEDVTELEAELSLP